MLEASDVFDRVRLTLALPGRGCTRHRWMQPLPDELSLKWKLQGEAHTFFRGLGWHRQGTPACEKRVMSRCQACRTAPRLHNNRALPGVKAAWDMIVSYGKRARCSTCMNRGKRHGRTYAKQYEHERIQKNFFTPHHLKLPPV